MAEKAKEPNQQDDDDPRAVALRLAKAFEYVGNTEPMPTRIDALVTETAGLLRGIAEGKIPYGLERISKNVLEILQWEKLDTETNDFAVIDNACRDVLVDASRCGLTVEGLELEPSRRQWQERR